MITAAFNGAETTTEVIAKITAIAEYYNGVGALNSCTTWGGVRSVINALLSYKTQPIINNNELAKSFIGKLNYINDENNYKTNVTFTPTSVALSVTIGLAVGSGKTAVIDWGDGTTTNVTNNGAYQNYAHTYASAGTYNGSLRNSGAVTALRIANETKVSLSITGMALTYLLLYNTGTAVTGVITGMALTYLSLSGTGTAVTGVITGMALTYLLLYGTGTAVTGVITGMELTSLLLYNTGTAVTGVITGMALTYLFLSGTGTAVTGVITGMALTYLLLYGTGTAVTGVLATAARLTREYIDITGMITLPINRTYGTIGSESMRINMTAYKLSSAEVDAALMRMAETTISSTTSIYIYGSARTSASDAAYSYLLTKTTSITITG